MLYLSESEWFLWGGIGAMAAAVILAVLCLIVFGYTGRKIKRQLEQEYGKLQG